MARGLDVRLPGTLQEILDGELGVFQARVSKRARSARVAADPEEILRPRQVTMFDKALMVLLWFYLQGIDRSDFLFPNVDAGKWRRVMATLGEKYWVGLHSFVPRSLRPGGACYLHLVHGWLLPDLVMRGGWARFESTHAYLSTGLYASVAVGLIPMVKEESRQLSQAWPRGLHLPAVLSDRMPDDLIERFTPFRGPGWGLEGATRLSRSGDGPTMRGPRGG